MRRAINHSRKIKPHGSLRPEQNRLESFKQLAAYASGPQSQKKFKVYSATTHGGPYTLSTVVSGGTSTTITLPVQSGTTYFVITAISTVANGSLESAYSNEGQKTVVIPTPGGCTLTVE